MKTDIANKIAWCLSVPYIRGLLYFIVFHSFPVSIPLYLCIIQAKRIAEEEARQMMRMPPVMNERPEIDDVLSDDPEIAGVINENMVFTDITFGVPDRVSDPMFRPSLLHYNGTMKSIESSKHNTSLSNRNLSYRRIHDISEQLLHQVKSALFT